MLTVIIVIHLMLVLALIGVVLLQKSEGGGLISSTTGFLSSRGTANVLSRTTALLAAGFFATSLVLSWLAGLDRKSGPSPLTGPAAPISQPGTAVPVTPPGGGVLDTLKQQDQKQAPAPGGPQVPRSQ